MNPEPEFEDENTRETLTLDFVALTDLRTVLRELDKLGAYFNGTVLIDSKTFVVQYSERFSAHEFVI
jgi:hypothetical protein